MSALNDIHVFLHEVTASTRPADKVETLVDLARGQRVLDIGCIDHSWQTAIGLGDDWLHKRLSKVASDLVGLDLLAEDAARLNEEGYRIIAGDAEGFDLGTTFDLAVAGDIIEHLANPGRFLECVRRHLAPGGKVAITTPNPFNIEQAALVARFGHVSVNEQHVLWLDPTTAHHLLRRTGFSVESFAWVDTRFTFPVFQRRSLRSLALRGAELLGRRRPLWRRDFLIVATPESD